MERRISPINIFRLMNSQRWLDIKPLRGELFRPITVAGRALIISSYGRMFTATGSGLMYNLRDGGRLKSSPDGTYVKMLVNRVNSYMHRLVYQAFVGPIPPGHVIDHKNGIKFDNTVANLRCCTYKQNSLFARSAEQLSSKMLITEQVRRERLLMH